VTAPKLCRDCGKPLKSKSGAHGGRPSLPLCLDCRDLEEIEFTAVKGWNRGPRGTLVGSFKPCNGTPCTEHAFCETNREDAA
jgi:hypothetical protein